MGATPSIVASTATLNVVIHLVLDANVVGTKAPLASNAVRTLLDVCREGRLRVVVPELVIREVVNKWREDSSMLLEQGERTQAELVRRQVVDARLGVPRPDVAAAAAVLDAKMRRDLEEVGALVPDLPKVPHATVVARALGRQAPFDQHGRDGYRDVLLWETVLALGTDPEVSEIVLVSRDRRAFGANRAADELSPDLRAEFARACGKETRVRLSCDPDAIVGELVDRDDGAFAKLDGLLKNAIFLADFRRELLIALGPGVEQSVLDARGVTSSLPAEAVTIDDYGDPPQLRLLRALSVDEELLGWLHVTMEVPVLVATPKTVARRMPAFVAPEYWDYDDELALVRLPASLAAGVEVVVDEHSGTLSSMGAQWREFRECTSTVTRQG